MKVLNLTKNQKKKNFQSLAHSCILEEITLSWLYISKETVVLLFKSTSSLLLYTKKRNCKNHTKNINNVTYVKTLLNIQAIIYFTRNSKLYKKLKKIKKVKEYTKNCYKVKNRKFINKSHL